MTSPNRAMLDWPHDPGFRSRVVADLKQGTDLGLRDPEMLESWRRMLTVILADLDSQFASRKIGQNQLDIALKRGSVEEEDYYEQTNAYLKWRRGALLFRLGVITRLTEANELLSLDYHTNDLAEVS